MHLTSTLDNQFDFYFASTGEFRPVRGRHGGEPAGGAAHAEQAPLHHLAAASHVQEK